MARKKIACVMTEYRVPAHADVIIGKFLNGTCEIGRMLSTQGCNDILHSFACSVHSGCAVSNMYVIVHHGAGVLTGIAADTHRYEGFPTDEGLLEPEVDIVSFYIDQYPESDIGRAVAAENGIEIYRSIKGALCLGGSTCAVDGVICIGEHGEYAMNEKGQAMFPRRYFFEQICGVIAASIQAGGQPIPVYTDKHLAYNWSVSAVDAVVNAK